VSQPGVGYLQDELQDGGGRGGHVPGHCQAAHTSQQVSTLSQYSENKLLEIFTGMEALNLSRKLRSIVKQVLGHSQA